MKRKPSVSERCGGGPWSVLQFASFGLRRNFSKDHTLPIRCAAVASRILVRLSVTFDVPLPASTVYITLGIGSCVHELWCDGDGEGKH